MKSRQLCAILMTMVMASSTFVPGYANTKVSQTATEQQFINSMKQLEKGESNLIETAKKANIKETDQVRIIVELEDKPVIAYAIQQGVELEDLNRSFSKQVSDDLNNTMDTVQKEIKSEGVDIEYHYEFVNVFNGFSATVTLEDAQKIETLPNVKKVFIATEFKNPELPEPDMYTSGDIVNTDQTWGEMGFKGEGMVVAVLDSSFAPEHPSMQTITDVTRAKFRGPEQIEAIGLGRGTWRNIKMPYAYNYYDNTQNVANKSNHGTHVAGTVAANGNPQTGGIKGIAPEAQVLGMKVFGDDPSISTTYDDIYVRAIEDSLKLGADAINMSLGSTAGFVQPEEDDPARVAIKNAAESGVVVNISAGNSNKFGSGHADPYNYNPDFGVLGSPSLNPESFSVASVENTHMVVNTLSLNDRKIAYQESGSISIVDALEKKPHEYVTCGIGQPNDFADKQLAGKIALVQRGSIGFGEKILNAQKAGAKGVIIFNSAVGGNSLMGMSYGPQEPEIKIPAVFVGIDNGLVLKNTSGASVVFDGGVTSISNPNAGKMSDFTSWGTTPNLDFKPEITAPGGQIYSTLQGDKYGLMSGTSMAAPHVSGGVALVLQRIDQDFGLFGKARYELAKNLMMSTAIPLRDKTTNEFVSPRRQGAGVMDLYAATSGSAIVVDPNTQISKINLREIQSNEVSFDVSLKNFSNQTIVYRPSISVATDLVKGMATPNNTSDDRILNMPTSIKGVATTVNVNGQNVTDGEIPVGSNETVNVTVTLNLENAKVGTADTAEAMPLTEVFPNGNFVEGFLRFEDVADETPTIGIPYMGFYGNWHSAPIIDVAKTNESAARTPFYGAVNGLITVDSNGDVFFLGAGSDGKYISDNIAFSPNNDDVYDNVGSVFTFLRNAKSYEVRILNENKEVVKQLAMNTHLRKNFYDGDAKNPKYYLKNEWRWDGTIDNEIVEGKYYYQILATLDYPGATAQEYLFPVVVDNQKPKVISQNFDKFKSVLTVKATDNFKIKYYAIMIDGKLVTSANGVFELAGKVKAGEKYTVAVFDVAGNMVTEDFLYEDPSTNPNDKPKIDLTTPKVLAFQTNTNVPFEGSVTTLRDLKSLTINGKNVEFMYDAAKKIATFKTTMTFEDGRHNPKVVAIDKAGNNYTFERKFYVDSHAPVLTLNESSLPGVVESQVNKVTLSGLASDNYSGLSVKVNGSLLFDKEGVSDTDKLVPINYNIQKDITLKTGQNVIKVELKDGAGNVTERTYNIYKKAVGEVITNDIVVDAPVIKNVSSENAFSFTATAKNAGDWVAEIKNPKGKVVKTFTAKQVKSLTGSWTPEKDVKLNGTYKLNLTCTMGKEVIKSTKTFEVYNYPLVIKALRVVKKSGFVTIEADIDSLSNNKQDPMLIIQVTDRKGRVINISTAKLTGLGANQSVTLSSGFATGESGVFKVEAFVWTGLENSQSLASPATTQYIVD